MTKEADMPDPIDPALAVALAAAAGLDPSDLKEQIRRQQAGDNPDKLRARIAELEARVSGQSDTPAALDAGAELQDAGWVNRPRRSSPMRFSPRGSTLRRGSGWRFVVLEGPMAKLRKTAHDVEPADFRRWLEGGAEWGLLG
jgi:hypothetical protein